MRVHTPGPENLTRDVLQDSVRELRAIGICDYSAFQIALAQLIIINTLGGGFWAKECTTFGDKQAFFRTKGDVRVVHLANMLWCLKDSEGFLHFLSRNHKGNFESTYFECTAAHWFLKDSRSIELVVPKGRRGADFDIRVEQFRNSVDLNVEVKARSRMFLGPKQLKNFLNDHRDQLPPGESGAIFCKVSLEGGGISKDDLILATQQFLRGTTRVRFVVFCWDGAVQDKVISLQYIAVDVNGKMSPIFPYADLGKELDYMEAAGL